MMALSLAKSILFRKVIIREINRQRLEKEKRRLEKVKKQRLSIIKIRLARKYI